MKMTCTKCGGEEFVKDGFSRKGVQRYMCVSENENGDICKCKVKPNIIDEDSEVTVGDMANAASKLQKSNQRLMDQKRILNKTSREENRIENAYVEYATALRDVIKENPIKIKVSHTKPTKVSKSVGIVQLTDLHFNELVTIEGNQYDFNIAAKRLKLFASKVKSVFESRNIYDIALVMTGDLMNSDRRTDEVISMAANRASATFVAVKILSFFLSELANSFNIKVISVSGNESRIREEYSHVDHFATDNFDFMIYEIIRLTFESNNIKNVEFISGQTQDYILTVNGLNILATHGNYMKKMGAADVNKVIKKYSDKGVSINNIICGHLHETLINNTLLRSGSLVGSNAYSETALNLHGIASQNCYMVDSEGNLDTVTFNLQNVDKIKEYPIGDTLNAYHAKSVDKIKETNKIKNIMSSIG
jgi:predicted phosphodiesterase